MKKLNIIFLLHFIFFNAPAQTSLQWHFNNTGSNNGIIYQMLRFSNGDVLVYGYNNTGDIDPGPGVDTARIEFFARYTSSGTMIFGRPLSYNNSNPNIRFGIMLDSEDNFYLSFGGNAIFDFDSVPGVGELNLTSGAHAFVKFDSLGFYKWSFAYNSDIVIFKYVGMSDKSVVVAGIDYSGTLDFDPGPGTFYMTSNTDYEGFVAKFDSAGNFITAKGFHVSNPGPLDDFYLIKMVKDENDNIYLSGTFVGTFDVDPGPATYYLSGTSQSPSPHDLFLVKLDSALNFVYGYKFQNAIRYAEIITDKFNGLYLSGHFDQTFDIDPSPGVTTLSTPAYYGTYFLAKFDSSGNFLWAKTMKTASSITGQILSVPYVDVDGFIGFDMYLPNSILTNSLGFPQLPNNGFNTPGQYMVKIDTSGTCSLCIRFPANQNPRTLVADANHFYFSGRVYQPTDIEIGPGITIDSSVLGSGWNEFFLSYYSIDAALNRIDGNAFVDMNNNFVKDPNELGLQNAIAQIAPGNYYLSTDNLGNYSAYVPSGNYNITVPVFPVTVSGPVPLSHSANFPGANQIDTANNFAFHCDTSDLDVAVYLTAYGQARAGMNFNYNVTYSNIGCTVQSGMVEVTLDSSVSLVSSTVTPSFINGQVLQWNYAALNTFQTSNINLIVHVDTTVVTGDTIKSTASITPLSGDNIPSNNFDTSSVVVTGSFDPNSKEINPSGNVTAANVSTGIDFTYTIYFQNTGNDTAFNIVILDTLPTLLDIPTLKIIASSHPHNFTLYPSRLMEFRFNNILLPDSIVNETLSHGFIKYQIRPKTNLIPGDLIENTAHIYFDFNSPVATNIVQTLIVNPVGLNEINSRGEYVVFPNPFTEKTLIRFENRNHAPVQISLIDVSGRTIKTFTTIDEEFILEGDGIEKGIYLLEMRIAGSKKYIKVLKLR